MSADLDDLRTLQQALTDYDAGVINGAELGGALLTVREAVTALVSEKLKASECDFCHGAKVVHCGQCSGRGYRGYESDPSYCGFCRRSGNIPCLGCS